MISRRRFLGLVGGAGVLATSGCSLRALVPDAAPGAKKKTLVVVQLAGGNDGLNTVVPDDGRYRDARPSVAIDEASLLRSTALAGYGLHPALAPIVPLVDAGDVCVVQSVGLHHQSRSHFECSQHWWDGGDGHQSLDTGWVGRWLDATKPSGTDNPLRAMAVGGGSGASALRSDASVSTVVIEPAAFTVADPAFAAALRATGAPYIVAALDAADALAAPFAGETRGGDLTADLTLAAELVTAGIGIEVLLVGAGGFDTHSGQAATHERLLGELAAGIAAFQTQITAAGMADRVLLLTTSEFGRRVAENGSAGTDHGAGSCLLAVGSSVQGGVIGDLDLTNLLDGDVAPAIDPRSFLAAGLDFLGGPTNEVFDSYEDLGVLA